MGSYPAPAHGPQVSVPGVNQDVGLDDDGVGFTGTLVTFAVRELEAARHGGVGLFTMTERLSETPTRHRGQASIGASALYQNVRYSLIDCDRHSVGLNDQMTGETKIHEQILPAEGLGGRI